MVGISRTHASVPALRVGIIANNTGIAPLQVLRARGSNGHGRSGAEASVDAIGVVTLARRAGRSGILLRTVHDEV